MSPANARLLFERSPASARPFLRMALARLAESGVALTLVDESCALGADGMPAAGWFECSPPEFVIAVGKPFKDWFMVAVHEFCHFLQWQENPEEFGRICREVELLFSWVAAETELSAQKAWELACVARDLANLSAFGVASLIDAEEYAQKANAYFNFYNFVGRRRAWYEGGREPYALPEVWTLFPKALCPESDLTPERERLFEQCAPNASAKAK